MKAGQMIVDAGQKFGTTSPERDNGTTRDKGGVGGVSSAFSEAEEVSSRKREGTNCPGTNGGTKDSSAGQVQPSAEATGRPGPFGAAVDCKEEHRRRFAADPRFAGWVAGSKA